MMTPWSRLTLSCWTAGKPPLPVVLVAGQRGRQATATQRGNARGRQRRRRRGQRHLLQQRPLSPFFQSRRVYLKRWPLSLCSPGQWGTWQQQRQQVRSSPCPCGSSCPPRATRRCSSASSPSSPRPRSSRPHCLLARTAERGMVLSQGFYRGVPCLTSCWPRTLLAKTS